MRLALSLTRRLTLTLTMKLTLGLTMKLAISLTLSCLLASRLVGAHALIVSPKHIVYCRAEPTVLKKYFQVASNGQRGLFRNYPRRADNADELETLCDRFRSSSRDTAMYLPLESGLDSTGKPALVLYFRVQFYVDTPLLLRLVDTF
uniref:Uncharacterized protein n=1 Tax=Timema poppense TaxID=170557 RepID=A0A7R9H2X9_TIMPO|nr:unnamed protein product [Timema poppensis]